MYNLTIVTPEKIEYESKVRMMIAPGGDGYLEILTNHAPIMTTLKAGPVTVVDEEGKKSVFQISGGLLEVSKNKATILADSIS